MFFISFRGTYMHKYREYSMGHIKLESCLDYLTGLVRQGWKLDRVRLIDGDSKLSLSVDAFDAEYMSDSIEDLQRQWKAILN